MIEHRGIKIVAGFQGDPEWITPDSPRIGDIDRAANRGPAAVETSPGWPIAFDWYDIAAAVSGSGRANEIARLRPQGASAGQEIPARVASQPDAAGMQGAVTNSPLGVSSETASAAVRGGRGDFSARADASGPKLCAGGRASKRGDDA